MIPGYEDFQEIGAGAWAQVYRARAPDGRLVAVKVLRPELSRDAGAARRFAREGRTLRALDHAAIPKVLDTLRTRDARPALVMEFVAGCDLHARIARGPSPWQCLVGVGVGVARALDHAHARGVIHRDIKPSNIMLVDGEALPEAVRVLDFGVAFRADETRLTRASHVGTHAYMAPEQGARAATPASDLYSLGVTLYHVGAGRLPEASERHDATRDMPAALESLLREMGSVDPLRRPASAREVEERLLALARPASEPAPRETLRRLAEQLRAKALELRAQHRELECLAEEARDGALSAADAARRDALREGAAAREQAERDVARRMAALDAALAALAGRHEA